MSTNQTKLDQIHDVTAGGQQTNFIKRMGTVLTPYVEGAVQRCAGFIADTILDTPIQRGGLAKDMGKTSLRSEIAYMTDNTIQVLNAANANANPDEVLAAVKKALEGQTLQAVPTALTAEEVQEVKA